MQVFFIIFILFFLSGCSNTLPTNIFISSPQSQKINNLIDADGDNVSDLIFWNTSSMTSKDKFLERCFFEWTGILNGKYKSIKYGDAGDFPFTGYFNEDSILDYGVVRFIPGALNEWYILNGETGEAYTVHLGRGNDFPCPQEIDGDGKTDVIIFDPLEATFKGYSSRNGSNFQVKHGEEGDIPVIKDYDGDGIGDFATYRRKNGTWLVKESSTQNIKEFSLGDFNSLPIPADYDGDGKADFCVWNYLNNSIKINLSSKGLVKDILLNKIASELKGKSYIPVPADYDGNKASELSFWNKDLKVLIAFDLSNSNDLKKKVYRFEKIKNSEPVNNFLFKDLINKNYTNSSVLNIDNKPLFLFYENGAAKTCVIENNECKNSKTLFKWEKDKKNIYPFISDFDRDYILDSCLWTKDTGTFLCNSSRVGLNFGLQVGLSGDIPITGDFNGDRVLDLATFRRENNAFYIRYLGMYSPIETEKIILETAKSENIVPLILDIDGDKKDDLTIYNFDTNSYTIKKSLTDEKINIQFEMSGDPILGDFDGDGKSDPGIINLKESTFSYHSSKAKNILSENLPENLSGNAFSGFIDEDLISEIIIFNPSGKTLTVFSLLDKKVLQKISLTNKDIKLSNCSWVGIK